MIANEKAGPSRLMGGLSGKYPAVGYEKQRQRWLAFSPDSPSIPRDVTLCSQAWSAGTVPQTHPEMGYMGVGVGC